MKIWFRAVFLLFASVALLAACSGNNSSSSLDSPISDPTPTNPTVPPPQTTSTFLASGGSSTSGMGGSGGYVYARSYGAVKVLKSGTVDASFDSTVSTPTPTMLTFGANHYIVSSDTTVELVTDDTSTISSLYTKSGDQYLYLGDGDGDTTDDPPVTGLTVNTGVTLTLVYSGLDDNTIWLSNDMLVNGTITADLTVNPSIYIEANVIDVESGGKVTASATALDSSGGSVYLGYNQGITKTIINRGTIEAKGLGSGSGGYVYFFADELIVNYGAIDVSGGSSTTSSGGGAGECDIFLNNAFSGQFHSSGTILAKGGDSSLNDIDNGTGGRGGYVYIDVPDLVVNTGTIDVSGGNSDFSGGGGGGACDFYVNYGDFYSSGTVRMNGGNGATYGGNTEAELGNWTDGYSALMWAAYGGISGSRQGNIIISGTWEANGGNGGSGNGGTGGYLYLDTDAMGAVTINATVSLRGGNSLLASGGSTYGIDIYSNSYIDPVAPGKIRIAGQYDLRGGSGDESGNNGGYLRIYSDGNNSSYVGSDVELVNFLVLIMNGGDGASGGSAASYAFQVNTNSPGGMPAGPITNEANIEARGGNGAATTGSSGGAGGIVEMLTNGTGTSPETVTNSGNIDTSGGTGDTGGSGNMINVGAQHVTNSGSLTSNGGNVTTGAVSGAGSGGNIYLNSNDAANPTVNTGSTSVVGGTPDGSAGTVNIDTGFGPL